MSLLLLLDGVAEGQTYTRTRESFIAATDSAVKSALRSRNAEDPFSVFDGGVTRAYERRAGSGLSPADSQSRFALYNREKTDSISVFDADRTLYWQILRSDTLAAGDDKTATYVPGDTGTTYTETKEDSIALIDAALKSVLRNRHAADAAELLDAALRSTIRNRAIPDGFSLTDEALRSILHGRTVNDSFNLFDDLIRSALRNRLAESSLALEDSESHSITGGATLERTATSELAVTDAGRTFYWNATRSDSLATDDDESHSIVGSGQTYTLTRESLATLADETLRSALRQRLLEDAFATVDQYWRSIQRTVIKSDNLALSDSEGVKRYFDVRAGSGIPVTDDEDHAIVGGGATYTQTKGDNIVLDDSGREAVYEINAISEMEVADSSLRSALRNRMVSDALALLDEQLSSVVGGAVVSRTATDAIDVTDAGRTIYWTIDATDYAALIDAVSYAVVGEGVINERTASDSLLPSDSTLRYAYRNRLLSDGITLTDGEGHTVYVPGEILTRLATDPFTVSDWVLFEVFGPVISRLATDGLLVTDDGRTIHWSVRRTDSATVIDEASATVSQPFLTSRRMTDEVRVGDQLVRIMMRSRILGDSLPVYDAVGRMPREVRATATGYSTLSDLFGYTWSESDTKTRLLTDAITITDTGRTFYWTIKRSEYISIVEQLLYTAGEFNAIFRTASDAVQFTDQLIRTLVKNRALSDGVLLYDAQNLGMYLDIYAQATDSLLPSDGTMRTLFLRRALMDAIVLADSIIGGAQPSTFTETLSDDLAVTDQAQRLVRAVRLASDTVRVLDEAIWQTFASGSIYGITLPDTLTLSDMAFRSVERNRLLQDAIAAQDDMLRERLLTRGLFDSVQVEDSIVKVRWNTRTLTEALGITDEALPRYIPYLPYVYYVRIILGAGDPVAILLATDDIRLFQSNVAILDVVADNPLGQATSINLGGYN